MKQGVMRFMGKTLHHNPHTIKITDTQSISQQEIPFLHSIARHTGTKAAVVSGDGTFYGADAYLQYLQLKKLYKSGKIGVLSIGGVPPIKEYLQQLRLKYTPVDDCAEYSFTFVEALDGSCKENSTAPTDYTVGENEELWDISAKLNISIDKLMKLNPAVKDPTAVAEGERVKISDF